MLISSPAAGDPYAAALDRALPSGSNDGAASASGSRTLDASPDVVVTLSQGLSPSSTYDAAGRMSGRPTLDDMGANGPASLVHATESMADSGDAASDGGGTADAAVAADDPGAAVNAQADTAVPA